MRRTYGIAITLAAASLCGCWPTVSEDILDTFTRVNDSLEASRARTEQGSVSLRSKLPSVPFADLGCPEFQTRADTMALALEKVARAMAPLFNDLTGIAQDDLDAGDKSFTTGNQGEALFTAITDAYTVATLIAPDDSTRMAIAEIRALSFPHASPEVWREAAFTKVPRAAVVTVLSKAQRDLDELRGMCDKALLKACMAKN